MNLKISYQLGAMSRELGVLNCSAIVMEVLKW